MNPLLHSNIIGEGDPLLILHGFLGMSDNWKSLGNKYTEQGFQVHLIDQRNHGRSFHSAEFDYSILANDLFTYISHYQLDAANIIGHSMGGKTAMQFAVTYPQRINKLLVADIAPRYYPPHHQKIIDALLALDLDALGSRSEADKKLSEHLDNFGVRQFLLKNLYWREKGKLAFRFNLNILQHRLEAIGATLTADHSFDGPTLFLRGGHSDYIHIDDQPLIHRHFPNAQIKTVENAGHWSHADNPKEFFEKSMDFLNS